MRVLFVRHGAITGGTDRLLLPDVSLNEDGRVQAATLGLALAGTRLHAIYSSPQPRARETAELLAVAHGGMPVNEAPLFDDLDADLWTSIPFENLDEDEAWMLYNANRTLAGCPGGETSLALFERVRAGLADLACRHAGETVAVVSHADVIRTAALDALGFTGDDWAEVTIDVGSVTLITWEAGRTQLAMLNLPASQIAQQGAGLSL